MKTFFGIVLYVLIGGFITHLIQPEFLKKCGRNIPDKGIAMVVSMWPAIVLMAVLDTEFKETDCRVDSLGEGDGR